MAKLNTASCSGTVGICSSAEVRGSVGASVWAEIKTSEGIVLAFSHSSVDVSYGSLMSSEPSAQLAIPVAKVPLRDTYLRHVAKRRQPVRRARFTD
jgi:hypothetical protein